MSSVFPKAKDILFTSDAGAVTVIIDDIGNLTLNGHRELRPFR